MIRRAWVYLLVTALAAAGVAAFFLAPASLWFTEGSPVAGESVHIPVYRSFSCAVFGYGDIYAPGWFGFNWGCAVPVPFPL